VTFSVKHLAISKASAAPFGAIATIVTAEDPTSRPSRRTTSEVASVNTNQKERDNHLHQRLPFKPDESLNDLRVHQRGS
jgi:polyisoprenoid-binding protein YceI